MISGLIDGELRLRAGVTHLEMSVLVIVPDVQEVLLRIVDVLGCYCYLGIIILFIDITGTKSTRRGDINKRGFHIFMK
jgi:hypothetical protein